MMELKNCTPSEFRPLVRRMEDVPKTVPVKWGPQILMRLDLSGAECAYKGTLNPYPTGYGNNGIATIDLATGQIVWLTPGTEVEMIEPHFRYRVVIKGVVWNEPPSPLPNP